MTIPATTKMYFCSPSIKDDNQYAGLSVKFIVAGKSPKVDGGYGGPPPENFEIQHFISCILGYFDGIYRCIFIHHFIYCKSQYSHLFSGTKNLKFILARIVNTSRKIHSKDAKDTYHNTDSNHTKHTNTHTHTHKHINTRAHKRSHCVIVSFSQEI